MSQQKGSGDTWSQLKTGFARAKHRVLAKVGAAETTVDTKIQAESDKLFTLFKLIKRINKNIAKYQDIIKDISILQNEMAHDILSFDEKDPQSLAYQECQRELERQRMEMQEYLEVYCHDPLRQYISQFREIEERLKELDVRRLDMDRYFRDYSIKANKGKDATSLAITESKHTRTKEGYLELSDELMHDMPILFNDRQNVFNPALAALINTSARLYANNSVAYGKGHHIASQINEYDSINHAWVITPVDQSAISTNVRSSAVFNSKTNEYSPSTRSRSATVGTSTPTSSPSYSPQMTSASQQPPAPLDASPVMLSKSPSPQMQSYQPPQPQPQPQQQYQPQPMAATPSPYSGAPSLAKPSTTTTTTMTTITTTTTNPQQQQQQPGNNTGLRVIKPAPGSSVYGTAAFSSASATKQPQQFNNPNAGRALPMPKTPVAAATAGKSLPQAEALFDFVGQDTSELSFKRGDILVLHTTTGEWLNAELNGARGTIPFNYIRMLE
ncbi:hypothetical protein SAMD00019534_105210 [Acytostelium subglobosum LB1]|uniref:hypothetical protein n=1 Tax=Acytostelium subglobosum LB1 TaxID=1410327 RepID=UPI0006452283|nr:hypothetical protein SAMD00019534_105210 [Acytostelium subglobosum LB1]GAM27346.1 hypothetical protein SAMD00019534_105210 [Acytostelium subglobosum LB1]|eukprot:XP_012749813.1 hypothetical protein SAMD00019534_105210 [Acytostelium subglobosum LB1]